MLISVFDRVENILGKGENAGYQHFLLSPQYFEKASFPVWEWVKVGVLHNLALDCYYQKNMIKVAYLCSLVWKQALFVLL